MNPKKIIPCFWYESEAQQAMQLYASLFPGAHSTKINDFLANCVIDNCEIWGINGGNRYKPNPTLSLYTICTSKEEINKAVDILSAEGKILMPLDAYDWSPGYAWVEDKYGVSWQLTLGKIEDMGQRITPAMMYVADQFGLAEKAINEYISLFPKSKIHFIHRYEDEAQKGKIAHAQFELTGERMIGQESGFMQDVAFTEGGSLVILCKDQAEIDHYWHAFTTKGVEGRCGWCKDQYGFSWQVIPAILNTLMADPVKGPKAVQAFLPMNKLEIQAILKATNEAG